MKKLLPYLVIGGVAVGLVALNKPAAAKTQPQPSPGPLPPAPRPPTDPAALLAQLNSLILAAATNPSSVDPAQLDSVAVALDSAGQPAAAAQARTLAAQIRLSRSAIPATGGWLPNAWWY